MPVIELNGLDAQAHDGVLRLTLRRPPRNLLSPDVMDALRAALLEADADAHVRAIVLTGEGEAFCGGLDVAQIRAGADPDAFAATLVELLRVLPRLGKPVIAAVNGDALAAGYGLVCAADLAVAVESARIGTFETSVGIWPMIAQVPALHRLHPRHAMENIITGEPFDAHRARDLGVVNQVVAAGDLWPEVERWTALSVRASVEAIAAGRRAFYRYRQLSYDDALTESREAFTALFATA